jgi:tRNA pseudouridine55 synthase
MSNDYKINIIHRDEYGRPSGIVALNKSANITSHDLVNELRKKLNTKKVGHAGALDVFADGVMIYLIGKATKLSDKLMHLDKEYITQIIFGIATDSQDPEGAVTEVKTGYDHTDLGDIESILKSFIGEYDQYVSLYSSVKVDGKKLRVLMRDERYEKHVEIDDNNRKKIIFTPKSDVNNVKPLTVILPSKKIKIFEIEIIEKGNISINEMGEFKAKLTTFPNTQLFPYIKIRVNSSKGTYIRQLAEDIGEKINMPAMLLNLTRTRVGNTKLEDCIKLDDVN